MEQKNLSAAETPRRRPPGRDSSAPCYPSSGCSPAAPASVSPDEKVCRTESETNGEIQNPPNAPPGARPLQLTARSVRTTASRLENTSILWQYRILQTSIPPVHQSVHLLVLTRPSMAGFNAPPDTNWKPMVVHIFHRAREECVSDITGPCQITKVIAMARFLQTVRG